MIHQINAVIDEINTVWKDFNFYHLEKIVELWNDPVSKEYIAKFDEVNSIVLKIINYLNLLKLYWENYENVGASRGQSYE